MVIPCVADIASDAAIAVIGEQIKGRTVAMVVYAAGVPVAGGVLEVSTDAINGCCNIKASGVLRLVRAAATAIRRGSVLFALGGQYRSEEVGVGTAWLSPESSRREIQHKK